MPDPGMNISSPPVQPPPQPLAEPPLGSPPSGDARGERLGAALDRLPSTWEVSASTVRPEGDTVTSQLVAAYLENRSAGVDQFFASHPDSLAALSQLSAEELDEKVEAELARQQPGLLGSLTRGMRGAAIGHAVERHLESAVRSEVYHDAQRRVNDVELSLRSLLADLPGAVDRLTRAEEGSPEAALAEAIGVRGDDADAWRIEHTVSMTLEQLERFDEYLQSPNLWDVGTFPRATANAVREIGLGAPLAGTLAHDAIFVGGPDARELAEEIFKMAWNAASRTPVVTTPIGAAISLTTDLVLEVVNAEIERRQLEMSQFGHAIGL